MKKGGCRSCGSTAYHWARSGQGWGYCSDCAPSSMRPRFSIERTVDRFFAYKTRNSMAPAVIPTLPRMGRDIYRDLKSTEEAGEAFKPGEAAFFKKHIQKLAHWDELREAGKAPDGRSIAEVEAQDHKHLMKDGTLRTDGDDLVKNYHWEPQGPKEPPLQLVENPPVRAVGGGGA
ncbi:MAG: hypothetical protein ACREH5_04470 [Candidatus Omnitrophota bacterium]